MTPELNHPHADAPPSGSDLARLFGLEELQMGRHYIRDADRARIGSIWVQSLWYAEIVPSFHGRSVLCVICAKGHEFRGKTSPDWHRVVFATPCHSAVMEIDVDPVAKSLSGFDLFQPGGNLALDGIAYKLVFETLELQGSLSFGNPSNPHLVALESALYLLASQVTRESNQKELGEAVTIWKEYMAVR